MSTPRQKVGRWGEQRAAEYLAVHGYQVIGRNLRTTHGEIDLLATREGMLVFVEVKTRTSASFAPPEAAVTPRKQAHMVAAAQDWLEAHPEGPETWQFDVIAIRGRPGREPEIEHFENVIA